jgi:hypothetical protein
MDGIAVVLIIIFSIFPDFDAFYGAHKQGGFENLDDRFQHHYSLWFHYPLSFTPFIVAFIVSLSINFYPLYFLIPVVGIYFGHFFIDTFACGDGIMWGKNPFKKNQYARFINVFYSKTDGYHGLHWNARYRQTIICKLANVLVIISAMLIQTFSIMSSILIFPGISIATLFYIGSVVYLLLMLYFGVEKVPDDYRKEPPNGRYSDYRIDSKYINGLSVKNKKRHLQKYSELLKDKGIHVNQ